VHTYRNNAFDSQRDNSEHRQQVDTTETVYVTGQVIGEADSVPEPNARVTLVGWSDHSVGTDSAGYFRFPVTTPGRWKLLAQYPGYILEERAVEVRCESRVVWFMGVPPPLKCPVPPQPVVIRMRSAEKAITNSGALRGRIVDEETDRRLAHVIVTVGGRLGAVTNSNGEFSIEVLEPGVYWVEATYLGYITERRLIVVAPQHGTIPRTSNVVTIAFWMRSLHITLD
jgi:hypothetical protein